jgi:hypothetical protein
LFSAVSFEDVSQTVSFLAFVIGIHESVFRINKLSIWVSTAVNFASQLSVIARASAVEDAVCWEVVVVDRALRRQEFDCVTRSNNFRTRITIVVIVTMALLNRYALFRNFIVQAILANTSRHTFSDIRFQTDVLQLFACLVTSVSTVIRDPSLLVTVITTSWVDNCRSVLQFAEWVAVLKIQLILFWGTFSGVE